MKREIIIDTETTGLEPSVGHRMIEIGCVELLGHVPTGKVFHHYINPERDVPPDAQRVHGISNEFLIGKPTFLEIASDFLDFVGDAPFVIHNASFDMGFINAELIRAGYQAFGKDRALDTLQMARKKFPGAANNLDALCKRFNIDLSGRDLHGALLDARLLAEVYIELMGGKQPDLAHLAQSPFTKNVAASTAAKNPAHNTIRPARSFPASADELAAHKVAVEKLKESFWA